MGRVPSSRREDQTVYSVFNFQFYFVSKRHDSAQSIHSDLRFKFSVFHHMYRRRAFQQLFKVFSIFRFLWFILHFSYYWHLRSMLLSDVDVFLLMWAVELSLL